MSVKWDWVYMVNRIFPIALELGVGLQTEGKNH